MDFNVVNQANHEIKILMTKTPIIYGTCQNKFTNFSTPNFPHTVHTNAWLINHTWSLHNVNSHCPHSLHQHLTSPTSLQCCCVHDMMTCVREYSYVAKEIKKFKINSGSCMHTYIHIKPQTSIAYGPVLLGPCSLGPNVKNTLSICK